MFRKILKVVCLLFVAVGLFMLYEGHQIALSNPSQSESYISSGFGVIVIFGLGFGAMFVKKAI